MINPHSNTDRGVSIAVTHVLTISITTILIAMLLLSGGTLLESEKERSAESSLETIGERLATEIENVDQMANSSETERVNVTTDHPRTVANSRYTIVLREDCGDDDAPLINGDDRPCLELTAQEIDAAVYVPLALENGIEEGPVPGGPIEISYDGDDDEIVLEEANR